MVLNNEFLNAGKDAPFCFCGATLEEVAKKAGVNAENLKETVAKYNSDIEMNGKDSVFGEAIPGLYACGEATGGVHGAAYMTGTALGKAFSFGRLAALDIANS